MSQQVDIRSDLLLERGDQEITDHDRLLRIALSESNDAKALAASHFSQVSVLRNEPRHESVLAHDLDERFEAELDSVSASTAMASAATLVATQASAIALRFEPQVSHETNEYMMCTAELTTTRSRCTDPQAST